LNWVTNHVINALLGTLNMEGLVEKVLLADCCIAYTKIKPLKWSNLPTFECPHEEKKRQG